MQMMRMNASIVIPNVWKGQEALGRQLVNSWCLTLISGTTRGGTLSLMTGEHTIASRGMRLTPSSFSGNPNITCPVPCDSGDTISDSEIENELHPQYDDTPKSPAPAMQYVEKPELTPSGTTTDASKKADSEKTVEKKKPKHP